MVLPHPVRYYAGRSIAPGRCRTAYAPRRAPRLRGGRPPGGGCPPRASVRAERGRGGSTGTVCNGFGRAAARAHEGTGGRRGGLGQGLRTPPDAAGQKNGRRRPRRWSRRRRARRRFSRPKSCAPGLRPLGPGGSGRVLGLGPEPAHHTNFYQDPRILDATGPPRTGRSPRPRRPRGPLPRGSAPPATPRRPGRCRGAAPARRGRRRAPRAARGRPSGRVPARAPRRRRPGLTTTH